MKNITTIVIAAIALCLIWSCVHTKKAQTIDNINKHTTMVLKDTPITLAKIPVDTMVKTPVDTLNKPMVVSRDTPTMTIDGRTQTVELKVGQKFNVVYTDECVGCRYVWHIVGIDTNKVQLLKESNANWPGEGKPGYTGGSQDHIFHFKALLPGTSVLAFDYFEHHTDITVVTK